MKSRRLLIRPAIMAIALAILPLFVYGEVQPQQVTPLQNGDKMLFIGNSYSDWSGPLPNVIQTLIKASGSDLNVSFTFKVKGMGILKEYATMAELGIMDEIKKGGWKYVVIQGWQDAIDTKDTNEKGYPACQDTMLKYLKIMDDEIVKVGAKTILYEPHVGSYSFMADKATSNGTYTKLKNAVSVFHAPIINGWDSVRTLYPPTKWQCPPNGDGFIGLLYADCGHQNTTGMALDAMIFYTLLTRRSAETLKPQIALRTNNPELYEELAAIAYGTAKNILAMNNCPVNDTQAPTVPSGLSVSNKLTDSFILSWTASSDDIGILGYHVYRDDQLIGTTSTPKFPVTGLLPETTYSIKVRAFDSEKKESGFSETIEVTTEPFIEVNLTGTLMSWDFEGSSAQESVTTPDIMQGISSTPPSSVIYKGPSFNVNSFRSNTFSMSGQSKNTLSEAIDANQYFTFSIAPQDGNSISIDSITFSTLSQNNRARNFTLLSNITGFTPDKALGTTTCNTQNGYIPGKIDVTGHENISTPVEFRIYVWGYDNQHEAFVIDNLKIEGTVKTLPLPPFPTELEAVDLTETGFTLKWKAAKDARSYEVFKDGISIGASNGLTKAVTGVAIGQTYAMTVKSTDSEGNISEEIEPLMVTIPDLHAPSVPQNLSASNIRQETFTLHWEASTDNVGIERYEVFMNDAEYGNTHDNGYMPLPGLTPSTTYRMRVRAADAYGNRSGLSPELTVTTLYPIGIEENKAGNEAVTVAPNPAKEAVSIHWNSSCKTSAIFIYDNAGKLLRQIDGLPNGSSADISSYAPGAYLIRVENTSGSYVKQLIVE